jgi:hypothetical protein
LKSFRPDIVGFASLTCESNTVIRLVAERRGQINPVIVVGGNHETYDPEYFNFTIFDHIVAGLGEKVFWN